MKRLIILLATLFSINLQSSEQRQTVALTSKEHLRYILEHKNEYPIETQHTLDDLLKDIPANINDPVVYLEELTELDKHYPGRIQDLRLLIYLTKLRKLHLTEQENLWDISPLAKLKNLEELGLQGNPSRTLRFIAGSNHINDIAALAQLKNLKKLNLRWNFIKDIRPLIQLSKLEELQLAGNWIEDISPLFQAQFINLRYLDLSDNKIQDINFLTNLTNLTCLHLDNNPIQNLNPLAKLKKLQTIYLDKDQIERLHAWTLLPGIEIIDAHIIQDLL